MAKPNSRILILSDLHAPFGHKDTIPFLKAIKKKYKPDRVISVGDEIDGHSMSFHEHNPDLMSPGDELKKAIEHLKPLYKMFPKVDLVESNHGSMVYRKGVFHGIPRHVFKSYREVIEAPKTWNWYPHLIITMSDSNKLYVCHSKGANALKNSQALGMSYVSGHHHESFSIQYWGNSLSLFFGMIVGCMINDDEICYQYNKLNLKRPIIGLAIIIDGLPKLLPMVLNSRGRWTGKVP